MKNILYIVWSVAMIYFSFLHEAEIVIAVNSTMGIYLLMRINDRLQNKRDSEF